MQSLGATTYYPVLEKKRLSSAFLQKSVNFKGELKELQVYSCEEYDLFCFLIVSRTTDPQSGLTSQVFSFERVATRLGHLG
jgi:hypothetical protein